MSAIIARSWVPICVDHPVIGAAAAIRRAIGSMSAARARAMGTSAHDSRHWRITGAAIHSYWPIRSIARARTSSGSAILLIDSRGSAALAAGLSPTSRSRIQAAAARRVSRKCSTVSTRWRVSGSASGMVATTASTSCRSAASTASLALRMARAISCADLSWASGSASRPARFMVLNGSMRSRCAAIARSRYGGYAASARRIASSSRPASLSDSTTSADLSGAGPEGAAPA